MEGMICRKCWSVWYNSPNICKKCGAIIPTNEDVQPYMKAYVDIVRPDGIRGYKYITWITGKHDEYRKRNGLGSNYPIEEDELLKFLYEEAGGNVKNS